MHSDFYLELSKKMAELLAVRWRFDSFCQKHHEASFHRQKSLLYFYTITQIIGRRDNWNIKIPIYFSISPNLEFGHHSKHNQIHTSLDTSSHLDLRNPIQLTAVHLWRDLWAKTSPCGWTHRPSKWELLAFNNFQHHGVVVSEHNFTKT